MRSFMKCLTILKPFVGVVWLQLGLAGMALITKYALNHGLNHYVFVVYRHVVATVVIAPFALIFERKVRPKMTRGIFAKILLLALLEPVMDQNLYYSGMVYTSATFTTALCNILPAFTFIMAWIWRLEKVNLKKTRSQAKVLGTVVTVGGAMLMTLIKGPVLGLPWTKGAHISHASSAIPTPHGQIKGAVMISAGCICWACFIILQAKTLESYPAELSLTALICGAGAVQGLVVALSMERNSTSIWAINLDSKLLACVYSGTVCSGIAYYIQGMIMKERGPVFITAFNPLSMVIVAVFSSFFLREKLFMGSVIGAIVIVVGLYLVVWGKSKDQSISRGPTTLPVASTETSKTTADPESCSDAKQATMDGALV